MKTFSMLSLSLGIALVVGASSCNNSSSDGARTVPMDSTNDAGAAPVQYQGGTPEQTTDTTMQSNTMEMRARQDNANARSMQEAQGANANGNQPESNTTDPKTTSGSSK